LFHIVALLLILLVFLIPRRRVKEYAPLFMLGTILYIWFMPRSGQFGFEFAGFTLELFKYRQYSRLVALALSFFAFTYYLYIRLHTHGRTFYFLSLVHVFAAIFILFVNDFMSFFIFWEMMTVSAVGLILLEDSPPQLIVKYFVYQLAGTIALFAGIALCYSQSGSMELVSHSSAYPFFTIAILIKAAVIPFHLWLPATYPKVSFDLSIFFTAFVTKIGVFSLLLLTPKLNLEVVGGIVALVAVLYAIKQNKLRNFLSYHILSQIGYILAGISGSGALVTAGGTYHLMNNVIYKGLLFMIVVIVATVLDSEKIQGEGGFVLTRKHPLLFASALVASLSISGIPPFNGFISKTILVAGLGSNLAANLLLAASVGTAFSFTKFIYFSFLKPGGKQKNISKYRIGFTKQSALFLLTAACILMGIIPEIFLSATPAAGMNFYTTAHIMEGLLPAVAAVSLFAISYQKISIAVDYITPNWTEVTLWPSALTDTLLTTLQKTHNGSLQRYVTWIFTTLLAAWIYLLHQSNHFLPLLKTTKAHFLSLLQTFPG
jgi:multicomponent Na+:H+ antiporter subunit D